MHISTQIAPTPVITPTEPATHNIQSGVKRIVCGIAFPPYEMLSHLARGGNKMVLTKTGHCEMQTRPTRASKQAENGDVRGSLLQRIPNHGAVEDHHSRHYER